MKEELLHACISERGGAELAHRVNFLSPVSMSHIDTSLFPWTAKQHSSKIIISIGYGQTKEVFCTERKYFTENSNF